MSCYPNHQSFTPTAGHSLPRPANSLYVLVITITSPLLQQQDTVSLVLPITCMSCLVHAADNIDHGVFTEPRTIAINISHKHSMASHTDIAAAISRIGRFIAPASPPPLPPAHREEQWGGKKKKKKKKSRTICVPSQTK
uniref:(California timema) hypothetical protein n=1 Tax=Timema californicum TaxID=61474 RepID=A0A7R9JEL3_TIMCA|nr:unnamed protein product [Timema californicum]